MIEQISKDAFLELASRTDAWDPNARHPDEPAIATDVRKAELPMSSDPRTPTVIDTDAINREYLTPRVEYVNEPEPTEDFDLSPQEIGVSDYHRGGTGRPANLGDSPNRDLIGEGSTPNVLDLAGVTEEPAKAAPKKPAARKKATTPRKSTKK